MIAQWLDFSYVRTAQMQTDHARRARGLINAARIGDFADSKNGYYAKWRPELVSLLSIFADLNAHEPRDYVYGFLGLYRRFIGDIPAALKPDYSRPLRDVFRDATRCAIEENKTLDIFQNLSRRPINGKEFSDWPTWVPLWHLKYNSNFHPYPMSPKAADHGEHMGLSPPTFATQNVLTLKGTHIGHVHVVSCTATEDTMRDYKDVRITVEGFRKLAQAAHSLQGEPSDEAFAMTLCVGDVTNGNGEQADPEYAAQSMRCFQNYQVDRSEEPQPDRDTDEAMALRFRDRVSQMCIHRRFFVTDHGQIGLGPHSMESDDAVVVLFGCGWPTILRPLGEAGHYEILGTACVYGIMNGQAIRSHRATGKDAGVFHAH